MMAGLLDNTEALLALGSGLLGSRGSFGQGLSQAVPGMMGVLQRQRQEKRQTTQDERLQAMQAIQMQAAQQQLAEQQRAAQEAQAQRQRDEEFSRMIPAPQGASLAQGSTPFGGFGINAPADPQDLLRYQALQMRQMTNMDYLNATKPQPRKLTSVAPGASLVDESDPSRAVFTAPDRQEKEDGFIRAMRAAGIPEGSAQWQSMLLDKVRKESSHAPAVSVSYGAPVAGVDASGKPIFFQPGKDGGPPKIMSGVAPPAKEMPSAMAEKFAQNAVTLQKIDKAIELIDGNPTALGLKNFAPDTLIQRLDPAGVEVRAFVADIAGQKIHDRSGAAVTVGEAARLKPYVPAATDNAEVAKTKLKMFRAEYAAMQQALASGASIKAAASGMAARAADSSSDVFDKADAIIRGGK